MTDHSHIQWTDATWNPVIGCTRVSEGCRNCYAEVMAARIANAAMAKSAGGAKLTQTEAGYTKVVKYRSARNNEILDLALPQWSNNVVCLEDRLNDPLKWKKPRRIFVNSMSDLFHKDVPFEFVDRVFAVMALCPQHVFQCLSKRPEIMVRYFESHPVDRIAALIQNARYEQGADIAFERAIRNRLDRIGLENCQASRSRREAWRGLLQGGQNESMSKGKSGIRHTRRVSIGDGDDERTPVGNWGTSTGVDETIRRDSRGHDDQSQEREKGGQSNRESGTGNLFRTETPRDSDVRSEALGLQGIASSKDEAAGGGRASHESDATIGGDGEGHRKEIPNADAGGFGDLHGSDLETYLVWPFKNIWLGVSCEDQAAADERIPLLLECPAAVRWVSMEPLLEYIDLRGIVSTDGDGPSKNLSWIGNGAGIDWVVIGGESGPNARLCSISWIRSIIDQCNSSGVPCFVKQLGSNPIDTRMRDCAGCLNPGLINTHYDATYQHPKKLNLKSRAGSDMSEWPEDLRIRQWPKEVKP